MACLDQLHNHKWFTLRSLIVMKIPEFIITDLFSKLKTLLNCTKNVNYCRRDDLIQLIVFNYFWYHSFIRTNIIIKKTTKQYLKHNMVNHNWKWNVDGSPSSKTMWPKHGQYMFQTLTIGNNFNATRYTYTHTLDTHTIPMWTFSNFVIVYVILYLSFYLIL